MEVRWRFSSTGLPTKDETLETTVRNLYCLVFFRDNCTEVILSSFLTFRDNCTEFILSSFYTFRDNCTELYCLVFLHLV